METKGISLIFLNSFFFFVLNNDFHNLNTFFHNLSFFVMNPVFFFNEWRFFWISFFFFLFFSFFLGPSRFLKSPVFFFKSGYGFFFIIITCETMICIDNLLIIQEKHKMLRLVKKFFSKESPDFCQKKKETIISYNHCTLEQCFR